MCGQYPTEFVKTTMQLSPKTLSVASVVRDTVNGPNGVRGLYRGLSSMVYFAAPKAGIRFSAFEAANGWLSDENGNDKFNLGAAKGFVAGLVAGSMEAIFVTTPQETIKIKLINDMFRTDGQPPRFRNFFHGVRTIISEESISGVYKGVVPTILKVSTAQVCVF
jgi:solute carrier family 25 citrate transporter 1